MSAIQDNPTTELDLKKKMLYTHIRRGDKEEVLKMVSGTNPQLDLKVMDKTFAGETPVHLAILHDKYEVLQALIQCGAIIDIPDDNKITPIVMGLGLKRINMVRLLVIEKDTLINSRSSDLFLTPLHLAVEQKNLESVKFFLQKKADISLTDRLGRTALLLALEKYECTKNDVEISMIKHLIKAGSDPEAKDKSGRNGFEVLTSDPNKSVSCAILDLLRPQ